MNTHATAEVQERLLKDRIIFLGVPIDETAANHVIAKILFLVEADRSSPIMLYVNSPGGSIPPSFGIIDAIGQSPAPVTTVCLSKAFGTAAMIVAHGSKGCRFALPEAVFGLVPLRMHGRGLRTREEDEHFSDIEKLVTHRLAEDTGQSPAVVRRDMRAALRLDAQQALNYGFIDGILNSPTRTSAQG